MTCAHLSEVRPVQPRTDGCEECIEQGMRWVELRLCLTCGHVGCCNSSTGRHAQAHYHATGHPLVRAFRGSQDWAYCFGDSVYVDTETIDQAVQAALHHANRMRHQAQARVFRFV
mgnify:FL=1